MAQEKKEKMIVDKLKPAAEAEFVMPSMVMENAIDAMAKMILAEGCTTGFGMTSGIGWPHEIYMMKNGIKRVHVRHESTAAFAADAWGRVTGRPGLMMIGSGTGLTNAATGIVPALNARSPVVGIVAGQTSSEDEKFGSQGTVQPEKVFAGLSKWTHLVSKPTDLLWVVKRAFRDSLEAPQGPCIVGIDFGFAIQADAPTVALQWEITPDYWVRTEPMKRLAPPDDIEATVRWIMEAEKPTIIAGPQVQYQDAAEELREFTKLMGIPTHCRRAGRGAISEYDPLNCYGRARGRVMRASDRCLVMGLKVSWLENSGRPPFWGADTRYIQLQACREDVNLVLATERELIGDMKSVLRQMIDCAKAMGITKPPEKWNDWRQYIADTREDYHRRAVERNKDMEGVVPMHPDILGKNLSEFAREELNDDFFYIIDGFTASTYSTDWMRIVHPGRALDAGETIGLGHGIGMAIGAGLATDRKVPILAMIGDGGIGCNGMDIETASRWNIPAIFVIWNNGDMGSGGWKPFLKGSMGRATGDDLLDSFGTLKDIRYDKMFAEVGCHPENVVKDSEIRPALKRAIDFVRRESKPAVINANTDPDVMQEVWQTGLAALTLVGTEWDEVPEEGKRLFLEGGMLGLEHFAYGIRPSAQQALMDYLAKKGQG